MSVLSGPRRQATAARNRRALLAADVEATSSFRHRLSVVLRWLFAEAVAAPRKEQDQLLADLYAAVDAMNTRRQAAGRKPR